MRETGIQIADHTQTYPGVLEFLEKDHDFQKAIVTNKPYQFSKNILEGLKISHHFSWVIGGDSLPVQKPSPLFLEPIFKETFFPKEKILMIGDSKIDMDTGKNTGIKTCAATYGFRPRQELLDCQPDYLMDCFTDFSKINFFEML